ncbi:hypothetical protein BC939DRAFT_462378 [Gamsiella multidivaricata]|uniref:uncharacterized protein n=1 Tax=Gamsiella multidivaricata TaxID=101098 RepID=UPI00221F0314|nr:uncharacterized protein BC939DRAFT_462378 [Gamsiella multidivaricata]KAI7818647.1 hypothetical protein BC939DRAFT_462378 [Gamsiella multidivaricata]
MSSRQGALAFSSCLTTLSFFLFCSPPFPFAFQTTMTDPDFEDAGDFDVKDISTILKDIDSANLALDVMDGRADKLRESIMSLLKAQSQPNPYANTEANSLELELDLDLDLNQEDDDIDYDDAAPTSNSSTSDAEDSLDLPTEARKISSLRAPPNSVAPSVASSYTPEHKAFQ